MTTPDYSLDRIGQRLSGEGLSEQEQILARDDKRRVAWILRQFDGDAHAYQRVVDVGASDGAIAKLVEERITAPVWRIEKHDAHRDMHEIWSSHTGGFVSFGDAFMALPTVSDGFFDHALLCEVLEHLPSPEAKRLAALVRRKAKRVIVTVPNVNSPSFDNEGRSRWNWPDHRTTFHAERLAYVLNTSVIAEPIVGSSLTDSIWLGTVVPGI